ncbi:MAG: hypothetical protein HGA98_01335, partial [Deltaproteobacteria bacterium]|nr:hypothetical protein [Deltaproteobacteria bacterium]
MDETASPWRDPWGWGLALWGALLAAAAYPPGVLGPLVLVGPAPLWAACLSSRPGPAFRRGWCYGLGFFAGLVWWIAPTGRGSFPYRVTVG